MPTVCRDHANKLFLVFIFANKIYTGVSVPTKNNPQFLRQKVNFETSLPVTENIIEYYNGLYILLVGSRSEAAVDYDYT